MMNILRGDRVAVVASGREGFVVSIGDGAQHGMPDAACVTVLADGEVDTRPHYPKELRRLPLVERPGDYKLPDAAYRVDPCPSPSLSPSLAIDLLSRSPIHAATEHPRIGRPVEPGRLDFDLGRAAHALLLDGDMAILPIEADDYRTAAAKAARERAYELGRIPVLAKHLAELQAMAASARVQLAAHEAGAVLLASGENLEIRPSLCWIESAGCWCRCRPDVVARMGDRLEVYQYVTTTGSAHPARWGARTLWGMGPDGELGRDVAAAFEARGALRVYGGRELAYRFVVQEQALPYALSVIELPRVVLADAGVQVERAIQAWAMCMCSGFPPAYPRHILPALPPSWLSGAVASLGRLSPLPGDERPVDEKLAAFMV